MWSSFRCIYVDLTITPMIDRLKNEVQNPTHIIPEDSMESWVRGGYHRVKL